MLLIAAFVILVLVGDLIAIGICSIVERFSEMGSLVLFLIMFAAIIPIAWRRAVQLTEPAGLLTRLGHYHRRHYIPQTKPSGSS